MYQVWKSDDGQKEGTQEEVKVYEDSMKNAATRAGFPWGVVNVGAERYLFSRSGNINPISYQGMQVIRGYLESTIPALEFLDKLTMHNGLIKERNIEAYQENSSNHQIILLLKEYDKFMNHFGR